MADAKDTKDKKAKLPVKKTQTVRERAEKATNAAPKTRRLRTTAGKVGRPLSAASRVGKREYHLPLPDNKIGRFLGKRGRLFPRYFVDAWNELREVTWPNARETTRMTFAVVMFSIIFAAVVALIDTGLGKIFRKVFVD